MSKQAVKPPGHSAPDRLSLRLPDLNARIRARRSQLGLTGVELAQRSGISASYVSLIETGAKVPDEEVAAELARALDDDEDLYRAWARAFRLGPDKLDLLNRLEAASRTPDYVSLVESGHELPKLPEADEAAELAARMRAVASRLASPLPVPDPPSESAAVVAVPVLADGADPSALEGHSTGRGGVVDSVLLDGRLVGSSAQGLFACDVTQRSMKHLRGVALPGDRVVFRRGATLGPDRICAVRRGSGLVLSRVLYNPGTLLLLPGDGESGFESVEVRDGAELARLVVGSHVLLMRR